MDKNTKDALSNIQEKLTLTEDENKLISYSNTAITAATNHSRVLSRFLLAKQLNKSTEQIIKSNETLAKSEDNHAKKTQNLTWALVTVGALQVIVAIINIWR